MIPIELDRLRRDIDLLFKEVRRLRAWQQEISAGDRVRATSITGIFGPSSGGTGVSGSILGAVSMWENNSGGARTQGEVVIRDGDRLFDVTTTQADPAVIGVLDDASVAAADNGRIRHLGYQSVVNVVNAVVAGDYLRTSTTSGRAETAGTTPVPGVFAVALTAFAGPGNGTVAAYLLGGDHWRELASAVSVTGAWIMADLVATMLGLTAATELTISAGGVVTPTQAYHRIDTNADAGSDDLDTITAGANGDALLLRPENDARTVILTTAGNLILPNGRSVTLDDIEDYALLVYDSAAGGWVLAATNVTPSVTHVLHFSKDGNLTAAVLSPRLRCVGEQTERGILTPIRAKAVAGTAGLGTNTIVVEADSDPAFGSATTIFTIALDTAGEADDTTPDSTWADGDIFVRARATAVDATPPQDVDVFLFYEERAEHL